MPSEGNVAAARAVIRQERGMTIDAPVTLNLLGAFDLCANGEPVALPPADPTAEW